MGEGVLENLGVPNILQGASLPAGFGGYCHAIVNINIEASAWLAQVRTWRCRTLCFALDSRRHRGLRGLVLATATPRRCKARPESSWPQLVSVFTMLDQQAGCPPRTHGGKMSDVPEQHAEMVEHRRAAGSAKLLRAVASAGSALCVQHSLRCA